MEAERKYKILINILSLLGVFALVGCSVKLLLYLIDGDEDKINLPNQ